MYHWYNLKMVAISLFSVYVISLAPSSADQSQKICPEDEQPAKWSSCKGSAIFPDNPTIERYEGSWLNGNPHGVGKLSYSNAEIFEGNFAFGNPQGYGRYRFRNGDVDEGNIVNGLFHGPGAILRSGKRTEGLWENGTFYLGEKSFTGLKCKRDCLDGFKSISDQHIYECRRLSYEAEMSLGEEFNRFSNPLDQARRCNLQVDQIILPRLERELSSCKLSCNFR